MSEQPCWIHIRNWERFQHYKKRGAPWIKDYVAQLHDDDYLSLTASQRGILHGLRLMYASSGGAGLNQVQCKRLLASNKGESSHFAKTLEALSDAGLILFSASKTLESCYQDARPETEGEKEPPYPLLSESAKTATGDSLTLLEERTVRRGRRRDELWDAMIEAFGAGKMTKSSRGLMNRMVAELREVEALPSEVPLKKAAFEERFPNARCTPSALVKHWPYLNGNGASSAQQADLQRSRELATKLREQRLEREAT